MIDPIASGPSATAPWSERSLAAGRPRTSVVLLRPDANNASPEAAGGPPVDYFLPKRPALAIKASGTPIFSLTLLLRRLPGPADATITPLVERAFLTCDLTLALSPAERAELTTDGLDHRPLFAERARFRLEADGATIEGSESLAAGPDARVGVSLNVGQEPAIAILSALSGAATNINVVVDVTYRTAASVWSVHLTGRWAAVYDALVAYAGGRPELARADVEACFAQMLQSGTITAADGSSGAETALTGTDPAPLLAVFFRGSSFMLPRTTSDLPADDPGNRYVLKVRPSEFFPLDIRQTVSSPQQLSIVLSAPLGQVLGGVLDGLDWDQYVHLVSPAEGNGGGLQPAPRRLMTRGRSIGSGTDGPVAMASLGNGEVRSMALALRPSATVRQSASVLAVTDAVRFLHTPDSSIRFGQLHDLALVSQAVTAVGSLPLVEDPSTPLWADRTNPAAYWYPLTFLLVQPAPNQAPTSSPFLFSFTEAGATVAGKPGLNGTVKFTLRPGMSDATRAALQAKGNPNAQPVPAGNLAVTLDVPFRDATGVTRTQPFPASVAWQGPVVVATVTLLDDWVRLCYGALGFPNFQTQPARLTVSYTYQAYVPVRTEQFEVAFGGKIAMIPVVKGAGTRADGPAPTASFEASAMKLQLPVGEVHFTREAPAARGTAIAGPLPARPVVLAALTLAAHPTLTVAPTHLSSTIWNGGSSGPILPSRLLATRTLIRQENTMVLLPATTYGELYRQATATGDVAVGARDALTLGQTTFRQYDELPELAHDLYRVYRSLQQPARFLVVPKTYRISRYPALQSGQAYRPIVYTYAALDGQTPANNRFVVTAALQPDLNPSDRRALMARLAGYSSRPNLEYPTEIPCQTTYVWTVGGGIRVEPEVVNAGDSFQVSLATDLAGALLLKTMLQHGGVFGGVTFTLPDGTTLESSLSLDLNAITGPWPAGPIEATWIPGAQIGSGAVRLVNRIERGLNVSRITVYQGDSDPGRPIPVGLPFPANGPPHDTPVLGVGAAAPEVVAAYTLAGGDPAALEEIRSFVEDVRINVIFLDLVNYANHNLKKLDVLARIQGVDGTYPIAVSEAEPTGQATIVLPLTGYLEHRILEFQVTKTDTSGKLTPTPWLGWNLDDKGVVVGLTWDLIA